MKLNMYSTKYSDSCPICGNRVPASDLFCERCGMRIFAHSSQKCTNVANRRDVVQSEPTVAKYGTHKLSEMPELKRFIADCESSLKTTNWGTNDLLDNYRRITLNKIRDIIVGDSRDQEVFDNLGVCFKEERDFGLDRCTQAAKEIFNLGVMMGWAELSMQQRMELAGAYAREVADAFELVSYKGVIICEFDAWGQCNGDGYIYLSNALMNPIVSPFRVIDTIVHESRHQYQYEVSSGYHNVPEEVVREWAIAEQIYRNDTEPSCYDPWAYYYSPLEIDARYAGETVVRNITQDLFNINTSKDGNGIDQHQLKARLVKDGYADDMLNQTMESLMKLDGKAAEMLMSWLKYDVTPEFDNVGEFNSVILRGKFNMKDPAIILAYGLLVNNPLQGSSFLKDMYNRQKGNSATKANRVSVYIFTNLRDYNNVKDAIYNANSTIFYKLDWYGSWLGAAGYDEVWRVDLNDDLTNNERMWVVGYIREHGGEYYQY